MFQRIVCVTTFVLIAAMLGCGKESDLAEDEDIQTVRLRFEGFSKSKSGAT